MPSPGRLLRDDLTAFVAATAFLPSPEAAAYVGASERTLRRRTAEGLLPAYRFGRSLRYRLDDLDALMEPVALGGES